MATTHDSLPTAWSVIVRAQNAHTTATVRQRCLEHLFIRYREPVKAMIRAWGIRDEDRIDECVQEYFTRFLEKKWLDRLDRERGRFRGFLKASVRSFLIDAHRKAQVQPGHVSLSPPEDEDRPALQMESTGPRPEEVFDRAWADRTLSLSLEHARQLCDQTDRHEDWTIFERHDLADTQPTYAETAVALGMKEAEVDRRLRRARQLFARCVRETIRRTVDTPARVDEELDALREALG